MKKHVLLTAASAILAIALAGCLEKEQLKTTAHAAILKYAEEKGQDQAVEYIDNLVADGKLGSANAEKLKAAIPQGMEKLKEVMTETEKEEEVQK